jgi:hypothetical protein
VIVYSHTLSSRLQYVVHFLSHYYQHPFKLTANEQAYATAEDFKINYSYQKIDEDEIYITPHALLFETEKRHVQVKCFEHNGYKAFFETSGELHFDLFAAIFFLLSRYEEYLPHTKDQFGLYAHQNSIAFEEGFLNQPLINIWLEDFRVRLEERFAGLSLPKNNFSFTPTYDIDIAWAYKHRGFKLHTGNVLRSLFKGQWNRARARKRTVDGRQQDPYDTYEWMDELHRKFNLHPIYFFLVAEIRGRYDKNTAITVSEFQKLIKKISTQYDIGIHPSWYSGDHPIYIRREKEWLNNISGKQIIKSRQHYLRFSLPRTFQQLINAGIKDEYSMGYGSINGFRASISSSFYWYNLEKEEATSLLLHPFCFMDANSFFEQKFAPQQGLEEMLAYYKSIKDVNGTMITLWHNNILGTDEEFAGWREVYEQFIEKLGSEFPL